jgi:hypothetical protein
VVLLLNASSVKATHLLTNLVDDTNDPGHASQVSRLKRRTKKRTSDYRTTFLSR